ncbi:hypothetical protein [Nocardia fluminea]|uniref:Uncharacterized protein n=1 Tax=Nocardia fluminea TaxID=134984 RepID=A0A2N3V6H3_9NOCA|nr:hypothetical protein [Nocardia fluminea]PKV77234.1 hypothetical protein ATK86_1564 [Nocardia fluminea]
MTALSTRTRVKAAALAGGVAVITAAVTGVASAHPGERPDDDRATTIICTAPGGENVPGSPPLLAEPGIHIERDIPGGPGREPGRIRIERGAPGHLAAPADGPVECRRIHADGERALVPAPETGSAGTQPARPY